MLKEEYMKAIHHVAVVGTMENLVGCEKAVASLAASDPDISCPDFAKIRNYYFAMMDRKIEEIRLDQIRKEETNENDH